MYITNLKKSKLSSAVFVEEEFWANIDNEVLEQNGIKIGMLVDNDFLSKLKIDSDFKQAKNKALYLLSFKDYSKQELLNKLKKDYCDKSAKKAIYRMEELGFINDEIFAQKYAKKLIFNKYFSKKRAKFEMYKKGIDKNIIDKVLSDIDFDAVNQIKILIDKKYKLAYSDEKVKNRAIAFLQRYGYSWDDINKAFEN